MATKSIKKRLSLSKKAKKPKKKPVKKLSDEEAFEFIQDKAFRLWDKANRPRGKDWEFWFRAEKEVKDKLKKLGKI